MLVPVFSTSLLASLVVPLVLQSLSNWFLPIKQLLLLSCLHISYFWKPPPFHLANSISVQLSVLGYTLFPDVLCIFLPQTLCSRLPLRSLETHYENVNLQKEQRGRAELFIPRYHELLAKQEEKRVSGARLCVFTCSIACSSCLSSTKWISGSQF